MANNRESKKSFVNYKISQLISSKDCGVTSFHGATGFITTIGRWGKSCICLNLQKKKLQELATAKKIREHTSLVNIFFDRENSNIISERYRLHPASTTTH
jgi:hypothetical protein